MSIQDDIGISSRLFWYSMLVVIIIIFATTALLQMKPEWLGYEREAYTSSHQYIEGHQTAMMQIASEIRQLDSRIASLEEGSGETELSHRLGLQRGALVSQLRMEAARLPDAEVPSEVRTILDGH